MVSRRQKSSSASDPFGLVAMPIARSARAEHSLTDYPKLATESAKAAGLQTIAKAIGGAVITLVMLAGLVAPPGPATESNAPTVSKAFAEWCPHVSASHVSASRASFADLVNFAWTMLR